MSGFGPGGQVRRQAVLLIGLATVIPLSFSLPRAQQSGPDYASMTEGMVYRLLTSLQPAARGTVLFFEDRLTERLSRSGRVIASQRAEYQWEVSSAGRRLRRTALDGVPVSDEFREADPSPQAAGWSGQQWRSLFQFRLAAAENSDEGPVLVIRFEPADSAVRPPGRLARVIGSLSGEVRYFPGQAARIGLRAELPRPVRFGIWIGAVNRLQIGLELQNLDGRWVSRGFTFEASVREWFRTRTVRQRRVYRDFQVLEDPADAPGEAAPVAPAGR